MKTVIVDNKNLIVNIVEESYYPAENRREYYPWNKIGAIYTSDEPLFYAQKRYINDAGAEFARRRDAIRWVEIDGFVCGFDCAVDDITNFMAAYTPLLIAQAGKTGYKVWLDENTKGLKELTYDDMRKAYDTVRTSQLEAYAWYENIKARLLAVTEAEGKEKLEEIFPIGE